MLVDSHCHLAHPSYKDKLDSVISNAFQSGVTKIITIGCSIKEAHESLAIANKYDGVFATAGLYPRDSIDDPNWKIPLDKKLEIIEDLAKSPKVVAIGECGMDFSQVHPSEIDYNEGEQRDRFEKQILMSVRMKKPLIIHSRNATRETIDVIKDYNGPLKAVWHCFSEGTETAEAALNSGLNISFTGNITYTKNVELREAVKMIPLERIMIETDAPYLTPDKARSQKVKINEPQYVRMVAEEIASIKGISLDEVAEKTTLNAMNFFSL